MPVKRREVTLEGYHFVVFNSRVIATSTGKVNEEELKKITKLYGEYHESVRNTGAPLKGVWQWCLNSEECRKAIYSPQCYIKKSGRNVFCSCDCKRKISNSRKITRIGRSPNDREIPKEGHAGEGKVFQLLESARQRKDLKLKDLAELTGYDISYLDRSLMGKIKFPIMMGPVLAKFLGLNPRDILQKLLVEKYPEWEGLINEIFVAQRPQKGLTVFYRKDVAARDNFISRSDQCFTILIKDSDTCISDGNGSIYVFTDKPTAEKFITKKGIAYGVAYSSTWEELAERSWPRFHTAIIYPKNGSGPFHKISLERLLSKKPETV